LYRNLLFFFFSGFGFDIKNTGSKNISWTMVLGGEAYAWLQAGGCMKTGSPKKKQKKTLRIGESNPGLPRDRRRY
jgi:hypothetical protein